jgi:penicillin-binding protein 1C
MKRTFWIYGLVIIGMSFSICWFCVPKPLFAPFYSYAIYDTDDQLIGAKIAQDGQWRFAITDALPEEYIIALTQYEDKRFFYHFGVDPLALISAIKYNLTHTGKRGGSTITMQIMRMAYGNQPRTKYQKVKEVLGAIWLEIYYTKQELLQIYASHAPFGGNIVGIEAATWRYFGKSVANMSWSEAALLAVLPNAPSIIRPGKNNNTLLIKRNKLLDNLSQKGLIDAVTIELAKLELLPEEPHILPNLAPHFLQKCIKDRLGFKVHSTIDQNVQNLALEVLKSRIGEYQANGIYNGAILIMDTESSKILAYVGNSEGQNHENANDMVLALRSSGSILKPFLFTAALNEGLMTHHQLMPDIPMSIDGFNPKNFDQMYRGAIGINEALKASLNIPFVSLLQQYGIPKFLNKLKQLNFTTLSKGADHYGLSVILGGGEVNLWEACNAYAQIGKSLLDYESEKKYVKKFGYPFFHKASLSRQKEKLNAEPLIFDAGSIYTTLEELSQLQRPSEEGNWTSFDSHRKIAWKTGTSFGFRDAWAIGVNPDYTIAVWVGNSDGEGRPGLIGGLKAAPLLFDLVNRLPHQKLWFSSPLSDMKYSYLCKTSGLPANEFCPVDTLITNRNYEQVLPCANHISILVNEANGQQILKECENQYNAIRKTTIFTLPSSQATYYRRYHADYMTPPEIDPSCQGHIAMNIKDRMSIIYPYPNSKIYLPIDLNEQKKGSVFTIAHSRPNAVVYWHIDDQFLGSTTDFHSQIVNLKVGKHLLTISDQFGNQVSTRFEVLGEG